MSVEEGWRTVDQAAEFLGVTRRAVHKYVQQGKLKPYKAGVGNRTLFRLEDLEAFKSPQPRAGSGTD
jgi:excisionase family DNA binding protein